jgi:hypothetical protein
MKQVFRFIEHLEHQQILPTLLDSLISLNLKSTWTLSDHNEFDHIDRKFTEALLLAEKSCTFSHTAPWHPNLHQCFLIYSYWQKAHSSKQNSKSIQLQLDDIIRKLTHLNTDQYQENKDRHSLSQLKVAKKRLQQERTKAEIHR